MRLEKETAEEVVKTFSNVHFLCSSCVTPVFMPNV